MIDLAKYIDLFEGQNINILKLVIHLESKNALQFSKNQSKVFNS